MNKLVLEFAHSEGKIQLSRTVFRLSSGRQFVAVRGKTSGAYKCAGSFQWTPAVKAVCIFFIRALACYLGHKPNTEALLSGSRGSLASSLDYAIDKEPQWLCDMFGQDDAGKSNLRSLVFRSNPGAKRLGPVSIIINESVLAPGNIKVFVDAVRIHDCAFLDSIVAALSDELQTNSAQLPVLSFASSMALTQSKRSETWKRRAAVRAVPVNEFGGLPQIEPADDANIADIFTYEEEEFPGHHATIERLHEWRDHDAANFMCIKIPGESVMGYYILFLLKPESMRRFLAGELLEDDVRAADLIEPTADNYSQQTDAHICVFASKRPFSLFTVDLFWHLLGRIGYMAQIGSLSTIYAEATTDEGERLLKRFKFEPSYNPYHKGDPLFQLRLTPATIRQWQQCYTDRSFSQPAMPVL